MSKLKDEEQSAVDIMKDHIRQWIEDGLRDNSRQGELSAIREATFNEFEEISPDRHKPLLLQALKEAVNEKVNKELSIKPGKVEATINESGIKLAGFS